jgi:hypothetical protein
MYNTNIIWIIFHVQSALCNQMKYTLGVFDVIQIDTHPLKRNTLRTVEYEVAVVLL